MLAQIGGQGCGCRREGPDHESGEPSGRESTDKPTLQGFVGERVADDATVYTNEHRAYVGLPHNHHAVKHSVSQYVDG